MLLPLSWRDLLQRDRAPAPVQDGELRSAARAMHAFLMLHLLLWTLVPSFSQTAPPWDNIEQLVWSQSLDWGYHKHPPAPTWWVAAWVGLLGHHVWVTYLAAQSGVAAALWLVWRTALLVTTPSRAFAATALTALVAYHSWRGGMPNHNTLQLLPVAMFSFALLQGVRSNRWYWWAGAGAAGALCLLSKYSALLWFAAALYWLLREPRMDRTRWMQVVLACVLGGILVAPHVAWLLRSGGSTLDYARVALDPQQGLNHVPAGLPQYLATQVVRLPGFAAGLALLAWLLRGLPRLPGGPTRQRTFLLVMGTGPLLLSVALGAAGVPMHASWASTFFLFAGLLSLPAIPAAAPAALIRAAFVAGMLVNGTMAATEAVVNGWLVDATGRRARSNFPATKLSAELQSRWLEQTAAPLRVISGETWFAGNIAARWPGRPLVLIDGDALKSPWIRPGEMAACGYIAAYQHSANLLDRPANVEGQVREAPIQGRIELRWGAAPLVVEYGIVPPGAACVQEQGKV